MSISPGQFRFGPSGCYYDTECGSIIHDGGPFSDKTCNCPRIANLEKSVEETYAKEISKAWVALEKAKAQFEPLNQQIKTYIEENVDRVPLPLKHGDLRFIEIPQEYWGRYNIVKIVEYTTGSDEHHGWYLEKLDLPAPPNTRKICWKYC